MDTHDLAKVLGGIIAVSDDEFAAAVDFRMDDAEACLAFLTGE